MNLSLVIPVYNEEANLPVWTRPFPSPSGSWQNVGALLDNRFFLPIACPRSRISPVVCNSSSTDWIVLSPERRVGLERMSCSIGAWRNCAGFRFRMKAVCFAFGLRLIILFTRIQLSYEGKGMTA